MRGSRYVLRSLTGLLALLSMVNIVLADWAERIVNLPLSLRAELKLRGRETSQLTESVTSAAHAPRSRRPGAVHRSLAPSKIAWPSDWHGTSKGWR